MAFLPVVLVLFCLSSSLADQFNCPSLPPLTKSAQNVYELKPQDIKVVMALGDSVTAAFAAAGQQLSIRDLYEYRGQSWSLGGDPNVSTIAAFIRHYTPNVTGASKGSHFVEFCYGIICFPDQYRPSEDVFNAAQTGAMLPNLVNHEFTYLYEQLTKNSAIDMKNDWKLLTILAGFNDVCLGCSGSVPFLTADDFEKHLVAVLEKVRENIPRVFVNIGELFNISLVYEVSKQSHYCESVHRILPIECYCAFAYGKEGDKTRREMDHLIAQYNEKIRKVAYEYSQKKYSEFAVVAQPGFRDGTAHHLPIGFLSSVDCFHPSIMGHQGMAKVIWNNMITPAAKKRTTFDFSDPFVCPTNTTLLYTY